MNTALDEDLTVLEGLDFDLPCQMKKPCDRPATWRLQVKCCSTEYTICEYHRTYILSRKNPLIHCDVCRYEWNTRNEINWVWTRL